MPWGWECRQRLVRQVPARPTQRRGPVFGEQTAPGPQSITLPPIIGGSGYSHVRRAPAYTFGLAAPSYRRTDKVKATLLSVCGLKSKGGTHRVKGGVFGRAAGEHSRTPLPGPTHYEPSTRCTRPRPPRYSVRPRARPPHSSPDCWSPAANMYHPVGYDRIGMAPAHSILAPVRELRRLDVPGPGMYNHNYAYVKRTAPRYSVGLLVARPDPKRHLPAPNVHCHKLFKSVLPTSPAPTFGIKHSRYIPEEPPRIAPDGIRAPDSTTRAPDSTTPAPDSTIRAPDATTPAPGACAPATNFPDRRN